jgi:mono/diheme cytochrome c family protein
MRSARKAWLRAGGSAILVAAGAVLALGCESQEEYRLRVARDVFDRKCAECHGSSKGEGPRLVEGTGAPAPDLRKLSLECGSPLPREELAKFIDGRSDVAAHGPRAMPVWGEALYDNLPENPTVEEMRAGTIDLLLDYLDTIQTGEAN